MIDITKEWQTRAGDRVRNLVAFNGPNERIAGIVVKEDGTEMLSTWYIDGRWLTFDEHDLDLVPVPTITRTYQTEYFDAPDANVREEGKSYKVSRSRSQIAGYTVRTYHDGVLHSVDFERR